MADKFVASPLEVIGGCGGDRAVHYLRFALRAGIPNIAELCMSPTACTPVVGS